MILVIHPSSIACQICCFGNSFADSCIKMLFNKSIVSGGILFCITYSANLLMSNDIFQEHSTGQFTNHILFTLMQRHSILNKSLHVKMFKKVFATTQMGLLNAYLNSVTFTVKVFKYHFSAVTLALQHFVPKTQSISTNVLINISSCTLEGISSPFKMT